MLVYDPAMDDNTTKVALTAIVLAFVVVIMRRFDRVSLHVERLKLDIFGLLKVGVGALQVAVQRGQEAKRRGINHRGGIVQAAPFMQGGAILTIPGNHDIDRIVVTHFDDDHLHGLPDFFRCPHHGSR